MSVKNKNDSYMKLKEVRIILKTKNNLQMVVEKEIEKALAIPQK